jgi:SAM-dependent methyltransferase
VGVEENELMAGVRRIIKGIPGSRTLWNLAWHSIRQVEVTVEFLRLRGLSRRQRPSLIPNWKERWFVLGDKTERTSFDRHYVYHTAWAVRQLMRHKPRQHVDISSSLYFVALGSAIVPMVHLDFRQPLLELDNLECAAGNLMELPFQDNSVESLSCMHVIEHIGLARYGDALDPCGDVKAATELSRVLAPGGRLLLVVPVGRPRICFNGHRIYDFEMAKDLFPGLTLSEWALIPDDASTGLVPAATPQMIAGQNYACGCFVFSKEASK